MTHIQKARYARMAERRQNLALPEEAIHEGGLMAPVSDKLDRDPLLDLSIGALRQIHGPHASVSKNAEQPVWTAARIRFEVVQ